MEEAHRPVEGDRRVEQAERLAADEGEDWKALALDAQDRYFDLAKEQT